MSVSLAGIKTRDSFITSPVNGFEKSSVTTFHAPLSMYRAFTHVWPGPPGLHDARNLQGTPAALRRVAFSLFTGLGLTNCVSSST